MVVAVAAELIARAWLTGSDGWSALELTVDHDRYEARTWRRLRGQKMPTTVKAVRAWLDAHPDDPSRASLLLRLGRLAEADEAIAAMTHAAGSSRPPERAGFDDVGRASAVPERP